MKYFRLSHGGRSLVGYSPWGSQRVGHDWSDLARMHAVWQSTPKFSDLKQQKLIVSLGFWESGMWQQLCWVVLAVVSHEAVVSYEVVVKPSARSAVTWRPEDVFPSSLTHLFHGLLDKGLSYLPCESLHKDVWVSFRNDCWLPQEQGRKGEREIVVSFIT